MWESMRGDVIAAFPPAPGLPTAAAAYMAAVKDSYARDAYNSLSIEGYRVTNELIDRVALGGWNPEKNEADEQSRDAMAARGYYQARIEVEASIGRMLAGSNAGIVASRDHRTGYRELFAPSVTAALLKAQDLAGHRGHQVYLRNAAHVPPPVEAVRDMMPAMFELLESEPQACVRTVPGALRSRVHAPIPRWQRQDGQVPDELDDDLRRVRVDGHRAGAPRRKHGGAGRSELTRERRALCQIRRLQRAPRG
jgi:hypothetical protein